MKKTFGCHKISPGTTGGEVLVSSDPILFYQTDPKTGIVIEEGHCLQGRSISGKIIVFPGGKGSSVVQADGMYKLDCNGMAPKGLIVEKLDTVLVSSAIIMELPMVDQVDAEFYTTVHDGDVISLDAERGEIVIQ